MGTQGTERMLLTHTPGSGTPWWPQALGRYAVEIVFVAILAATYVQMLRVSSGSYFFGDDWTLLRQAGSFRGMLEPYNDHLSVTILGVYRTFAEVFGFTYWP